MTMTIPVSLGEALLVNGNLKSNHIAQRISEGRFILSKSLTTKDTKSTEEEQGST